jgi:hypothetical protein
VPNRVIRYYPVRRQPTRRSVDATLILGDSFDIMPTLGEVDVIITDPPNNPKTHKRARPAKSLAASLIDFDSLTEEKFIEFCANAVAQTKCWVVMSCAWQHAAQLEKAVFRSCALAYGQSTMQLRNLPGTGPERDGRQSPSFIAKGKSVGTAAAIMPFGPATSNTASTRRKSPSVVAGLGCQVHRAGRTGTRSVYGKWHNRSCLREARQEIRRHRKRHQVFRDGMFAHRCRKPAREWPPAQQKRYGAV